MTDAQGILGLGMAGGGAAQPGSFADVDLPCLSTRVTSARLTSSGPRPCFARSAAAHRPPASRILGRVRPPSSIRVLGGPGTKEWAWPKTASFFNLAPAKPRTPQDRSGSDIAFNAPLKCFDFFNFSHFF